MTYIQNKHQNQQSGHSQYQTLRATPHVETPLRYDIAPDFMNLSHPRFQLLLHADDGTMPVTSTPYQLYIAHHQLYISTSVAVHPRTIWSSSGRTHVCSLLTIAGAINQNCSHTLVALLNNWRSHATRQLQVETIVYLTTCSFWLQFGRLCLCHCFTHPNPLLEMSMDRGVCFLPSWESGFSAVPALQVFLEYT